MCILLTLSIQKSSLEAWHETSEQVGIRIAMNKWVWHMWLCVYCQGGISLDATVGRGTLYYVLPLERIELIYSNSCTVNHCGGGSPRSAFAITPFGRNSSKHGVCYYFQGFHMYIWDVRRKINPLLLGFRNVFIKNPESWYHRSCFENGSTTWMFKEHGSCFTDSFLQF